MSPQLTAGRIIEIELHIELRAHTVVGDDEGSDITAGITLAVDADAARFAFHHFERQLRSRRVIQHIPRPEQQLVLAFRQFRNTESNLTAPIITEIISEIAV